ncbi:hypothetical protein V866_008398 [Kwoniella sp. B9012]
MHEITLRILSISPPVLAPEEIMIDVDINAKIDMDMDIDQDYFDPCSHYFPQIIYPESSFQSFFNLIATPSRSMIDPRIISQLVYVDELQDRDQEFEIDHEEMWIQDLPTPSEDEPDSQTDSAKTIGQDDIEGPSSSSMPISTNNNHRMFNQKFPTPSLRVMPRITSPIQATFATGSNLIPLGRRPPGFFGNPTSVNSNIHPHRIPFFAPSMINSRPTPFANNPSRSGFDLMTRLNPEDNFIDRSWKTKPHSHSHSHFGTRQIPPASYTQNKRGLACPKGCLKVPLTREEVMANERIAQCRAAIKRHMVLRSYLIFKEKGPVPIDPTCVANHPS